LNKSIGCFSDSSFNSPPPNLPLKGEEFKECISDLMAMSDRIPMICIDDCDISLPREEEDFKECISDLMAMSDRIPMICIDDWLGRILKNAFQI
jgi:hypothetical protein